MSRLRTGAARADLRRQQTHRRLSDTSGNNPVGRNVSWGRNQNTGLKETANPIDYAGRFPQVIETSSPLVISARISRRSPGANDSTV